MSNVRRLMAGREPGDMPSPQDFHSAMDRDRRTDEPTTVEKVSMGVGCLFVGVLIVLGIVWIVARTIDTAALRDEGYERCLKEAVSAYEVSRCR